MHEVTYEYVDTRGLWPIYVRGQYAVKLDGKPRTISLEDARETARAIKPFKG